MKKHKRSVQKAMILFLLFMLNLFSADKSILAKHVYN